MPKIILDISDEHHPVLLAFLKTLPYVKVVEEESTEAVISSMQPNTSNSDYQPGQADELNNELEDLFGES